MSIYSLKLSANQLYIMIKLVNIFRVVSATEAPAEWENTKSFALQTGANAWGATHFVFQVTFFSVFVPVDVAICELHNVEAVFRLCLWIAASGSLSYA